jgi:hypothetical protein
MYSRWVRFLAWITGAVFLRGAIYTFVFIFGDRTESAFLRMAVSLGIISIAGGLAFYFARIERRKEQALRNLSAQRLAEEAVEKAKQYMEGILSGKNTAPFALYLRPFVLEREFRQMNAIGPRSLAIEGVRTNFDSVLQGDLDHLDMPLIRIGGFDDHHEGAGKVTTTDSSWRETFRQLAERAETIIIIPGMQPGITTEIRWLRISGLLVKAIFFKPRGYPRAEWLRVQEFYDQEEDIELPDYSPRQLSFKMYSSGRCHDVMLWRLVFGNKTAERGQRQMRALLANESVPDD